MKFLLDHDVPDDLSYLPGNSATKSRCCVRHFRAIPRTRPFSGLPHEAGCILLTCNWDDSLHLAATKPHHGIVTIIRRRTRGEEPVAMLRLLDRAGETGLRNNVNFA